MTLQLRRLLALVVAVTLLSGCALLKDRFRGAPMHGQTEEQRVQDQEECNAIALANKGSAAQSSAAMGAIGVTVGAGALAGATTGMALGVGLASMGARVAAGAGAGAAAGLLILAIGEVERRGTEIYMACMQSRGYMVGQ